MSSNKSAPLKETYSMSKEASQQFMDLLPEIVDELYEKTKNYGNPQAGRFFMKGLQYSTQGGKNNRGLLVTQTFRHLADKKLQTPENIKKTLYLGWCIELIHAMFLVCDDMIDESITRRGRLCWHKVEGVGMDAINDALMIENSAFIIMKSHFRDTNYYLNLLELFHEMIYITVYGQSLDIQGSKTSVQYFTMDMYKAIVSNKTSHYTFFVPFAIAMYMTGRDPVNFEYVKDILMEMGFFFQIQDDFLDCFGNPEVTGKVGTDIQDNKCSWLAVTCLERATPEEKEIMVQNYGHHDPEKVARIKQLYTDMGLPAIYAACEDELYKHIKNTIDETSNDISHEALYHILNTIYRRDV